MLVSTYQMIASSWEHCHCVWPSAICIPKPMKSFGSIRTDSHESFLQWVHFIGKRLPKCWIEGPLFESSVIAEGSVEKLLLGKYYNRAVRFHKLLYEALRRLARKAFIEFPGKGESSDLQSPVNTISLDICQETFTETSSSPLFLSLANGFEAYKNSLRQHVRSLAILLMSYFDVRLNMLRASRNEASRRKSQFQGNWDLHLSAIRDMILWCFANNKHTYARYLSTYYSDMTNLSQEYPNALEQ